jgi:PAS domain S-box-containing protein
MVLKNRVKSWSALFEFYSWFLVLAWSIIIGSMLVFGLFQIRQVQREIVQKEARANFSKDQAIRLWATMHGGVYVPATAETPPNPYLSHVPERDLKTPSGIELTLMNPAYMLRQTMDKYEMRYGIHGHITSLKHFRPETGPDEWEKDALKEFEKGMKEVFDFAEIGGKPYFRFMAPMMTKRDCLKCHGHQEYKVGDVRGGVSVAVPMAPYLANQRRQTISYSISFILLWLFGFTGIFFTSRGLKHRILERDRAEAELKKAHIKLEQRVAERTIELTQANIQLKNEIEERKQAEAAFRDSEQFANKILESSLNGLYIFDFEEQLNVYINSQYTELTGYPLASLHSMGEREFKKLFFPDDLPKIVRHMDEVMQAKDGEGIEIEYRFKKSDGDWMWCFSRDAVFERKSDGVPKQLIGTFLDITDRKRAEEKLSKLNLELEERVKQRTAQLGKEVIERKQADEKLRKNKEMLQMVFDGISEPLVMLGKNLEIRLLNKAANAYYHVGQRNVVGKPCHQALRGISGKCENCEIPAAVVNDQPLMLERDGFMDASRIEQVVVYPIENKDTGEGAAIIRISDITDEKMIRKQIVQTEKLSSLGFLVAGVAHEINNPNNFISFNIPILKEYLNEILPIIDDYARGHENFELFGMTYPLFREDVLKLVDNIGNGSRRINIAVANLRGISRTKEKTNMDWIDVKEVIEKSVSIFRSKINRMVKLFEVNISDDLPLIYTDSGAIETAVINLLINAAQAVDKDNSWIRLKVAFDDSSQNDLIIDVSDNGCGIEETIKNYIFDPFFTTKSPSEGTGLGLSLCHYSIKESGGRIEVDSVAGKGSTFKVILPGNGLNKNEIG